MFQASYLATIAMWQLPHVFATYNINYITLRRGSWSASYPATPGQLRGNKDIIIAFDDESFSKGSDSAVHLLVWVQSSPYALSLNASFQKNNSSFLTPSRLLVSAYPSLRFLRKQFAGYHSS